MYSVEIASRKGWTNIWLETDSQLVVMAFSNGLDIPWKLQNRWSNCIGLVKTMNFNVTHIYREGSVCADRLASYGLHHQGFTWWDSFPSFIGEEFGRNRLGLPNYRFS